MCDMLTLSAHNALQRQNALAEGKPESLRPTPAAPDREAGGRTEARLRKASGRGGVPARSAGLVTTAHRRGCQRYDRPADLSSGARVERSTLET